MSKKPHRPFPSLQPRVFGVVFVLALAYVWLAHFMLIYALPDPIFQPDSEGYLQGVLAHLDGKAFDIPHVRATGYPLFLRAVLQFSETFKPILLIQHIMHVLGALSLAALYGWHRPRSKYVALALFFVAALLPRQTFFDHAILTEACYVSLQCVAIAVFFASIHRRSWRKALAAGFLVALAVNTRDVGLSLVVAIGLLLAWGYRYARIRQAGLWAMGGLVLGCLPFLVYNASQRGIQGTERRSTYWVVGNMAQYLDLSHVQDPELHQALAPLYTVPLHVRLQHKDPHWPSQDIFRIVEAHPRLKTQAEKIYVQLSWDIVRHAPGSVMRYMAETVWAFLTVSSQVLRPIEPVEHIVQRSLAEFFNMTQDIPATRRFAVFHNTAWKDYFHHISSLRVFPFDDTWPGWRPAWFIAPFMKMIAIVGLLSGCLVLRSRRHGVLAGFCLAIIVTQIAPVAAGGGFASRYSVPLDPLYLLLIGLALREGGQALRSIRRSGR